MTKTDQERPEKSVWIGDSAWLDALARASAATGSDRAVTFFQEEREDASVELDTACGVPTLERARTRGIAVEEDSGPGYVVADAGSDDAERLACHGAAAVVLGRRGAPTSSDLRLPVEQATRMVEELARVALGLQPTARVVVRWVGFEQRIHLAGHGRSATFDRRLGQRVRIRIDVRRGGRQASAVGEAILRPGHKEPRKKALEQLVEEVATRSELRLAARAMATAERPVVFAPGVGGIFIHETVGHALEADTIVGGASWLAAPTGSDFRGPRELLVIDDPRRARAAWRADDEGETARPTCLMRGGVVAGWLHDRVSAASTGGTPTGHGRRSGFREPVRPRMGCTFLAAGRADPEEALRGIEEGVYVRRMESASTDTAAGQASFRVSDADRIRHGRLVAPLLPHVLHLHAHAALSSVDCIANDLAFDTCVGACVHHGQPLSISVGAPTFRIGGAGVVF